MPQTARQVVNKYKLYNMKINFLLGLLFFSLAFNVGAQHLVFDIYNDDGNMIEKNYIEVFYSKDSAIVCFNGVNRKVIQAYSVVNDSLTSYFLHHKTLLKEKLSDRKQNVKLRLTQSHSIADTSVLGFVCKPYSIDEPGKPRIFYVSDSLSLDVLNKIFDLEGIKGLPLLVKSENNNLQLSAIDTKKWIMPNVSDFVFK